MCYNWLTVPCAEFYDTKEAAMNEKEVSELRRRLRPDRCGITHIRGCCVNENREVIAQFDQSLALLGQDEGSNHNSAIGASPQPMLHRPSKNGQ